MLWKPSFYSILVRLKVDTCNRWSDHAPCFYSILVRLKVKSITNNSTALSMFLFHTGSIKREHIPKNVNATQKSFYSILVRLKVISNLTSPGAPSFYSILVRLKARNDSQRPKDQGCFYSILVRLKASHRWPVAFSLNSEVSIPYWFD